MIVLAAFLPVGILMVWLIPDRPNPAWPKGNPGLPKFAEPPPIRVGDGVVLGSPSMDGAWLAVDEETSREWDAAIRSGDRERSLQFVRDGKVSRLPLGTRAEVVAVGDRSCRVKCPDGVAGWVSRDIVGAAH